MMTTNLDRVGVIGGIPAGTLLRFLNNSEYPSILNALANERNAQVRLTWLREHALAPQFHATLMCELALEEFRFYQHRVTVYSLSIPLIDVAYLRALQDYSCCRNSEGRSFLHEAKIFQKQYMQKLESEWQEISEEPIEFSLEQIRALKDRRLRYIWEVARATNLGELPNPRWAFMNLQRQGNLDMRLIPTDEWISCRKRIVRKAMDKLSENVREEMEVIQARERALSLQRDRIIEIQEEVASSHTSSSCCSIS
ncbi:MAG TPA: hypothetical protein VJK48_04950 [Chlamydiales bacterium]|nr:hypothetical protein [Chlamydiales bacterium]